MYKLITNRNTQIRKGCWNIQAIYKVLLWESRESIGRRLEWCSICIRSSPDHVKGNVALCTLTTNPFIASLLCLSTSSSGCLNGSYFSIESKSVRATFQLFAKDAAVIPCDSVDHSVRHINNGRQLWVDFFLVLVVIQLLEGNTVYDDRQCVSAFRKKNCNTKSRKSFPFSLTLFVMRHEWQCPCRQSFLALLWHFFG